MFTSAEVFRVVSRREATRAPATRRSAWLARRPKLRAERDHLGFELISWLEASLRCLHQGVYLADDVANWQLALGNWRWATGDRRQLAIGNWQLAIGNWQLATGNWRVAIGDWQHSYWQPPT